MPIAYVRYCNRAITTAYVQVVGWTRLSAWQNAKRVGTRLREQLPDTATVVAPRDAGLHPNHNCVVVEIPVIIGECGEAKAIINRMVMRGQAA